MRRATQDADTLDDWCAIMKKGNNGGYANAWLLGDVNRGEIARLELGLKVVGLERSRDGVFAGSNLPENLRLMRFETNVVDTDIRNSAVARRVRWKQLLGAARGRLDAPLARRLEADHRDPFLGKDGPCARGICSHHECDTDPAGWGSPYEPAGTMDGKVLDAPMARAMSFSARWGSACGRPFDAPAFLAAHPQFDWMQDILTSRPRQPWVTFKAGETGPR
jgi:hypothetical protein